MEENTSDKTKWLPKDEFRDILINESNDDVIIPISATFDKAVLHIGIRNRRDIRIEKPDVKRGKEAITSVEYATRAFSEKPDNNEINEKNRKYRKVDRNSLVNARSAKMQKQKQSRKQLPKFYSSLGCKLQFELLDIKSAAETVSETNHLKEAKSENAKGDIDVLRESSESITAPEFINVSLLVELPDTKQKDMVFEVLNVVKPCQASSDTNIVNDVEMSDTIAVKLYKSSVNQIPALGTTSFENANETLRKTDTFNKSVQQNMLANATAHKEDVLKPTETGQPDQVALYSTQADDINLEEVLAMCKRSSRVDTKNIPAAPQNIERLTEEMFADQSDIIKDVILQKRNEVNISDKVLVSKECATKALVLEPHDQDDVERDAIRPLNSTSKLSQSCDGEEDLPKHVIFPFEKYVIIAIETEDKNTETAHRDKHFISEVVTIEQADFKAFVTTQGYQSDSTQEVVIKMDNEFTASEAKPCYQSDTKENGTILMEIEARAPETTPHYQSNRIEEYKAQLESKGKAAPETIHRYQHDSTDDELTQAQIEVNDSETTSPCRSNSIGSDAINAESEFTESDTTPSYQCAGTEDDDKECEVRAFKTTSRYQSDNKEIETTQAVTVTQSDDLSDYIDVAALMEREARSSESTPSDHADMAADILTHIERVDRANVTEHWSQADVVGDAIAPMKNDLKSDESSHGLSVSLNSATNVESAVIVNESEHRDQLGNTENDSLRNEGGTSFYETTSLLQSEAVDVVMQVENENRISQRMSVGQSDETAVEITTHTEEAIGTPNNLHNEIVEVTLAEIVETALLEAQRREENTIPANVDISNTVINRSEVENDGMFGIMNIYAESDLHCDVNKIDNTEASTEKTDFGYLFFSLSNFCS